MLMAALAVVGSGVAVPALAQHADYQSQQASMSQGEVRASEMMKGSATITKIDKENKTLTLKDKAGDSFDVTAQNMPKFDKLKVGDRVHATYRREIALSRWQKGQPTGPSEKQKVSGRGEEPGGTMTREIMTTAKVTKVDTKNSILELKDSRGKTHDIKVEDPALQSKLGKLKKGDRLNVQYTQTVAVSVSPASA
jgi:hypothetical protein